MQTKINPGGQEAAPPASDDGEGEATRTCAACGLTPVDVENDVVAEHEFTLGHRCAGSGKPPRRR